MTNWRWVLLMSIVPTIVLAQKSVQDRVQEYGAVAAQRWAPYFEQAEIAYPPRAVTLIGLKEEKLLEVWLLERMVRSDSFAPIPFKPPVENSDRNCGRE